MLQDARGLLDERAPLLRCGLEYRVELTLTPAADPVTGTTQVDKGVSIRAGCGVSPTDLPPGKFSVKPCP